MHMADALLSPAVGGTMWAVSAAAIAYCSGKVRREMDDRRIPLMGVLGAFIFAAQMISFTIPATGSSGHLGGGLILSILLGPHAAFLTIASVLVVQALFFADGGLLALGCNMFNLGFFPAFIAYPLVYKKIVGSGTSPAGISVASMAAAIIALQLGAFGVVVETVLSGISSIPFSSFVVIMQPIHLAIGFAEGLVTSSVISFMYSARPEILKNPMEGGPSGAHPIRTVVPGLLVVTFLTGGFLSWFASDHPDGLEWSIIKATGNEEPAGPAPRGHVLLADLQRKLSFLPDYTFRKVTEAVPPQMPSPPSAGQQLIPETKKPERSRLGTGISGIIGGALTLGLSFLIGAVLKHKTRTA